MPKQIRVTEQELIEALSKAETVEEAAEMLGISRRYLYKLIKKYELEEEFERIKFRKLDKEKRIRRILGRYALSVIAESFLRRAIFAKWIEETLYPKIQKDVDINNPAEVLEFLDKCVDFYLKYRGIVEEYEAQVEILKKLVAKLYSEKQELEENQRIKEKALELLVHQAQKEQDRKNSNNSLIRLWKSVLFTSLNSKRVR